MFPYDNFIDARRVFSLCRVVDNAAASPKETKDVSSLIQYLSCFVWLIADVFISSACAEWNVIVIGLNLFVAIISVKVSISLDCVFVSTLSKLDKCLLLL